MVISVVTVVFGQIVNSSMTSGSSDPGSIKQRFETRREGRGGGRAIAICGSLTAHFNFKNRC